MERRWLHRDRYLRCYAERLDRGHGNLHARHSGHDGTDGAVGPDCDGGKRHPDQPELDGFDRQRGGDRLSGRALPGRGLLELCPDRDPDPTTFNDTGRTANTSYSYRVRATDAVPNLSGYSNTASATTPAAAGLVAGYAFSEGSGTTTADSSGNGITGTLVGGPTWVAGRNGTGLSFNGSSTYVDLGTSAALGFTGSMTLSAWVYETANVGDDGQIVAKSDGGSGWQLKSTPDTGPRTFGIAITNSSGGDVQRYSSTVRALNTWYHVAGVYDATAQTLNIYVNGVLSNGTSVRHGSDLPARLHRRRQHRPPDGWLQHSRHRGRRADLRPSAQCRGDPGRYGHAGRRSGRRHDAAVGADQSHRHGGLVVADQPELDRVHRQRRR